MNLHEYQAKTLFSAYGIPVPDFRVIDSADKLQAALSEIGTEKWVLKAQVHAGGRGKAGGVKVLDNSEQATDFVKAMLGKHLVTFQTNEQGQPVNQILIEAPSDIERELYLGAVVDRGQRKITIMASTEGGMDIEKVAAETPEKILKAEVDPVVGIQPYQCRDLGFALGFNGAQIKQFSQIVMKLVKMFTENDFSLVEVNPLIVSKNGDLLCIDAKVNIDDNALFRHKDLAELNDTSQEDEREVRAREWDLNYIALDGEIGCMVNGAGLAMATMDLIKLHGGEPANFLDVGGAATKERVVEAFKIILSDKNVKGILVNIFGGIVRCDMIAEGIAGAVEEVGVNVPVVVRLEGNNADAGLKILDESPLHLDTAHNLNDAAEKIVQRVKGENG